MPSSLDTADTAAARRTSLRVARPPRGTAAAARAGIVDYYDQCERDYRLVWNLRRSLAMHYGHWDASTRTLGDALLRQNELLAAAAGIRVGDRVLDAGCGVGGSAIHLARRRGAHVTGITLSLRQAATAYRHARRLGVSARTGFFVSDYLRAAVGECRFDVVWALESMCYADDTAAFAREAFHALRPGGRLVVADAFTIDRPDVPDAEDRRRAWLACWLVRRLETVERFAAQCAAAGFADVAWDDVTAHVMPSARRLWRWSLCTLPLGRLLQTVGLRSAVQTRNILGCRLQYPIFRDGLVRYALVSATKPAGA